MKGNSFTPETLGEILLRDKLDVKRISENTGISKNIIQGLAEGRFDFTPQYDCLLTSCLNLPVGYFLNPENRV